MNHRLEVSPGLIEVFVSVLAMSPCGYLLLMSSESLMSLREHMLLFRVLPVPPPVRPAGQKKAEFTAPLHRHGQEIMIIITTSLGHGKQRLGMHFVF